MLLDGIIDAVPDQNPEVLTALEVLASHFGRLESRRAASSRPSRSTFDRIDSYLL